MKKNTIYIILYYVSFVISLSLIFIPNLFINIFGLGEEITEYLVSNTFISIMLEGINIVLVILFTIKILQKQRDLNVNIMFPIVYMVFTFIILLGCNLFNRRLVIPNIQFTYYIVFILINFLLLNIYSVLSFEKNRKSK